MSAKRELAFDILKGIGITEVMLHHVLNNSARRFTEPDSTEWWGLMLTNRILHFAIPTFLLASALLLARSLAKHDQPDWKRFFVRRGQRTLWPYLVWSGIYLLLRGFWMQGGGDGTMTAVALPFGGGEVMLPYALANGEQVLRGLVMGKSYFHLYFLVVLLQMSVAFPLLFLFFRKFKVGFGATLLGAFLLQLAVYWLQANVFRFGAPASSMFWYLPAICIGTWLGVNWKQWEQTWMAWRWQLIALAGAGCAAYLSVSTLKFQSAGLSSLAYSVSFTVYTTALALVLLRASVWLSNRRFGQALAWLGNLSLALFLVHPMLLYLQAGPKVTAFLQTLPFPPIWNAALLFLTTITVTLAIAAVRMDGVLFGRRFFEREEEAKLARPTLVTAEPSPARKVS